MIYKRKETRQIYFFCGIHGPQQIGRILWGGVELVCGCRFTHVDQEWVFVSEEDRNKL